MSQTERKHEKACDESPACSPCSGHTRHTRDALGIQTYKTNLGLSRFPSRASGLLFPKHALSPLLLSYSLSPFLSPVSDPDGLGHAYVLHSPYSITGQQLLPQVWLEGLNTAQLQKH